MHSSRVLKLKNTGVLEKIGLWACFLIAFIISIDHKYDRPFRYLSKKVIPSNLSFACNFDRNIHYYLSDIFALILLFIFIVTFKKNLKQTFLDKGAYLLWGFFISALASIAFSPFFAYFTVYTRLLQVLTCITIYTFIVNTPSPLVTTRSILKIVVGMAAFQSILGISQYFTQAHLGLRFLGELKGAFASFEMGSGHLWFFDNLFNVTRNSHTIFRSYGTFHHCNVLGGFLAIGLLASFPFYVLLQKKREKIAFLALFMTIFFALCLTFSRSAIFGFFLSSICWFGWTYLKGSTQNLKSLAASLILVTILSFGLLHEQFLSRGGIINYNQTSLNSDLGRLTAQSVALSIVQENPLQGAGFQQFSEKSTQLGTSTGVHNIFLFVASEIGLVGLFFYIAFIIYVLRGAFLSPSSVYLTTLMSMFGCLLMIGFCDLYPFFFQAGKLMFFMFAALIVCETHRLRRPQNKIIGFACPK